MADEDVTKEGAGGEGGGAVEGTAAKGGGKSSSMKWIIIGVAALLVIGGGGFVAFSMLSSKDDAAETEEAVEEEGSEKMSSLDVGHMLGLDVFIVNLAGEGGSRYLKVKLELELSVENLKAEIGNRLPQIRDTILVSMSSKSFADIDTAQGKFRLKEEIVGHVNKLLTTGNIKNVYFTEFVIQ